MIGYNSAYLGGVQQLNVSFSSNSTSETITESNRMTIGALVDKGVVMSS